MTINLLHITATNGGSVIQLEFSFSEGDFSERRVLKLLDWQYIDLRPEKGEITPFFYDELEVASAICEAYTVALNILSFGANTAYTLKQKLRRRGFADSVSTEVVAILASKGYINENREIEREVERSLRKKWGMRRIMAHLHSKGYDEEALAHIDDELSEYDFSEACYDLLLSKYDEFPSDPNEVRKVIASLVRYGYTMSEIQEAISKMKQ